MFGGSGFPAGGYGGYNDSGNGGNEGGGFGGASDQIGGAGYGGANFQAQPSIGGPGGFLSSQATQATPAAPGLNRQMRREEQCLMPVTIKMLLKQKDLMQQQGQDGTMTIHGRQVCMLVLVACVESCEQQINQQVYTVSDATGQITVSKFNQQGEAVTAVERGTYVRIYGIMRSWQNECKVTAHHIAPIEKCEEIALHAIEVAHAWLELTGRLKKKAPQQPTNQPQQQQQKGYLPPQQQGYQAPQQQGYQPPQQPTYQPPQQSAYQHPQQQQQSSYHPQQQHQQYQSQQQAQQQQGYGTLGPGGAGFGGAQPPISHVQYGNNQQHGPPQVGQPANHLGYVQHAQQPQQASFNQQLQQLNNPSPYANAQAPGVVH